MCAPAQPLAYTVSLALAIGKRGETLQTRTVFVGLLLLLLLLFSWWGLLYRAFLESPWRSEVLASGRLCAREATTPPSAAHSGGSFSVAVDSAPEDLADVPR